MPTIDIRLDLLPCGVLGMSLVGVPRRSAVWPSARSAETPPSASLRASLFAGGSASSGESSLHCSTSTSPSRSLTCPSFPPGARPPRWIATIAAP